MSGLGKGIIKEWKCVVCGEIVKGVEPPEVCPVCGVGSDKFVEVSSVSNFKSEEKIKILVLGGGVAGLSAAEAARKRNNKAEIEIISDEEVFCYNRPMLTKGLISDFDANKFFTKQLDWYEKNNIKFTLGTKVIEIKSAEKVVVFENGDIRTYDKLIYALGAESNKIPLPGADLPGVFVIRKLADANAIREKLAEINKVIIIGGGILGIEAAWEFARANKQVTVLDIGPRIMGRQLDEDASQMLVEAIEKEGGQVFTEVAIDGIKGDDKVRGVVLNDGTLMEADTVIISAGIKTNVNVGLDAGLKGERFIEVNEKMESSIQDIYAAGDVAAYDGVSIGIWSQADAMGKVAGANAAGDDVIYKRIIPSTSFVGFGTKLFSIGDVGSNGELNYQVKEVGDVVNNISTKLYFINDKLCGGILFGNTDKTMNLLEAYKERASIDDEKISALLNG